MKVFVLVARFVLNLPVRPFHEDISICSNKLREALGLKENELPPYIYQMRVLGYPPGHLQHARTSRSQMAIFGSNGEGWFEYIT